jgi:hypothetical protein
MSEFKFNRILFLIFVFGLGLLVSFVIEGDKKTKPIEQSYPHTLSIYTAEGDTLLDMDTESEYVKIWIEENGELDIWTLGEYGWKRN